MAVLRATTGLTDLQPACSLCVGAGVGAAIGSKAIAAFEAECSQQLAALVELVRGPLTSLERITLGERGLGGVGGWGVGLHGADCCVCLTTA